jgi:hypothetical protein
MTLSSAADSQDRSSQWHLLQPVDRYVANELLVVFDR